MLKSCLREKKENDCIFVAIGTVHLDFFVNDAVAEPGNLGEDVAAAESLMTWKMSGNACVCGCFFWRKYLPGRLSPW